MKKIILLLVFSLVLFITIVFNNTIDVKAESISASEIDDTTIGHIYISNNEFIEEHNRSSLIKSIVDNSPNIHTNKPYFIVYKVNKNEFSIYQSMYDEVKLSNFFESNSINTIGSYSYYSTFDSNTLQLKTSGGSLSIASPVNCYETTCYIFYSTIPIIIDTELINSDVINPNYPNDSLAFIKNDLLNVEEPEITLNFSNYIYDLNDQMPTLLDLQLNVTVKDYQNRTEIVPLFDLTEVIWDKVGTYDYKICVTDEDLNTSSVIATITITDRFAVAEDDNDNIFFDNIKEFFYNLEDDIQDLNLFTNENGESNWLVISTLGIIGIIIVFILFKFFIYIFSLGKKNYSKRKNNRSKERYKR